VPFPPVFDNPGAGIFSTPATPAGFFLFSNMTDETATSPETSPIPETENVPRVRRISTPRPKKVAKAAAPVEESAPPAAEIPSIPFPSAEPREREDDVEAPSQPGADWPEPEAESAGGTQSQTESAKRKRRRRKGKGQSGAPQNSGGPVSEEVNTAESKSSEASQEQRPRPPAPQPQQHHQQQRPKIDPELLTKMAWKIYLAEVSEEGVALIGDNDAKDLSRRCFRLAEIFIEEQSRRR
jgi:hypothetical protein